MKNLFINLTCLLVLFSFESFSINPEKEYKALPSDYGIIFKELSITTEDGLTLNAWFYPAQDTNGIANQIVGKVLPVPEELKKKERPYSVSYDNRMPTIIICDGDAGNMTYMIFYAYHFFTKGFNVLTFDWRGFGKSSDWQMDKDRLCYAEFINDYDAVINYTRSLSEVDTNKIGVMGFSTGAYLSFAIFSKREDISAFCGRALITSFDDLLSVLSEVDTTRTFIAPPDYPEELLPINAAGKIDRPVFLIVGEKDIRTLPWMSEKIMELLNGEKELWIVPGAQHGGMNGPELYNYPEFFNRVYLFFNEYL
jgi:alpha-beta hydrolase superfamily lysophospholipase